MGTYLVDQSIAIAYAATDALSGVATSTGQSTQSDAYTYPLGVTTQAANDRDRADNVGFATTSFTVRVTHESLCNLFRRFVTNDGVENSLCSKLAAAAASTARGNLTPARNQLDAYAREVKAISGKWVTAGQAEILIRLVAALA